MCLKQRSFTAGSAMFSEVGEDLGGGGEVAGPLGLNLRAQVRGVGEVHAQRRRERGLRCIFWRTRGGGARPFVRRDEKEDAAFSFQLPRRKR